MGKFIEDFRKSFKEELTKKIRPHFETALANTLANQGVELNDEAFDLTVDDFIFYLKKSVEAKK